MADSTTLALASTFTLSAWVAPEGAGWRTILSRQAGPPETGYGYAWYVEPAGHVDLWISLGGQLRVVHGATVLPVATWSHVAVTYDGAQLRLYVNGVLDGTLAASVGLAVSTRPVQMGADWYGDWYSGRLDEVRVYAQALSLAELNDARTQPVDGALPLAVTAVSPATGSRGVLAAPIQVVFSRALDAGSVSASAFSLRDAGNNVVNVATAYEAASRTVTLTPSSALAPLTTYTVTALSGASGVHDTTNGTLATEVTWSFTTAAAGSLIAAWGFEEASGATALDATGNGNDGTIAGATRTAGKFGAGLTLDGASDVMTVAGSETLALGGALTFTAWVAPEGTGWRTILSRQAGPPETGYGYAWYVEPAGHADLWVSLGGSSASCMARPCCPWPHGRTWR